MSGAEDRVPFGQPGRRGDSEGVGLVGVVGEFAVAGRPPDRLRPPLLGELVGRDRAEGLDRPLRWLVESLLGEVGAACVGGVGQGF